MSGRTKSRAGMSRGKEETKVSGGRLSSPDLLFGSHLSFRVPTWIFLATVLLTRIKCKYAAHIVAVRFRPRKPEHLGLR